ncbi:MAG: T9SS type A sorting domain-containing protein [Flavobacteriales bacterium]|nr:T9SS type A sorting domain-containing protein [Flavobacteriales bacterium]
MHNLIGYEFAGEPTLASANIPTLRTRHDLCELVTSWNDVTKAADPDHLTCVGAGFFQDVFRNGWEPMIFPVDYASSHWYPGPDMYEDPATYKQSMTERYLNNFRFYDRYLKKPYILDETGFSAEDPLHPPDYTNPNPYLHYPLACWGDEQDQQDFVENTFLPIRDSRCAGYSWWIFHNQWVTDPNANNTNPTDPTYISLPGFKERYFGLLRFGGADPNPAPGQTGWEGSRKLVAATFAAYAANPPAPAPMAPVPAALDMNDRYFNPYMHPVNNTTHADEGSTPWTFGTLTGQVVNQTSEGIAGAVLLGGAIVAPAKPLQNRPNPIYYNYYTYTDDDGYFEIRGKDPLPSLNERAESLLTDPGNTKDGTIQTLEVGAYASQWTGSGWAGEDGSDAFEANHTYILNSLQYRYDVVLDNIVIPSGTTEDHSGLSTLTAEDVTIAGSSELKARYEVHLKPGFHATTSSECHIYTVPLNLTCDEISGAQLFSVQQTQGGASGYRSPTNTEKKEVPLDFHFKEFSIQLDVFPNPASEQVKVQLTGSALDGNAHWDLLLLNSEGKEILGQPFSGMSCALDMAPLASGTYTVVVRSSDRTLRQRIVKP